MTPSHVRWPPIALTRTIANKIAASAKRGIFLSLPWVAQLFSLSPFEVQTLVVCLAPELRRKYDTLYAYLQDDITRKRPSVDLVLDVLCPSEAERWRARTAVFSDQAPLFRHGILHRVEDPRSPSGASGLAQFLQLDQRMLHYILENDGLDGCLAGYATMLHPAETLEQVLVDPTLKTRLVNLCQRRLASTARWTATLRFLLPGTLWHRQTRPCPGSVCAVGPPPPVRRYGTLTRPRARCRDGVTIGMP